MKKFSFLLLSFLMVLFFSSCGDGNTGSNDGEVSSSALSSAEEGVSSDRSNDGDSSALSSDGVPSSAEEISSSTLAKCVEACAIGTIYRVGDRCSRGFKNWIAIVENSTLPGEETMKYWEEEESCNK